MPNEENDWRIFRGDGTQHDMLTRLPKPPPWRFSREIPDLQLPPPDKLDFNANRQRAIPFKPSEEMVRAVNAALYLRRPLLITGKPGTGKSTLIYKVAHELMLGPVIRWSITSRSTVRSGVYEYDAVGRLQAGENAPPIEKYITLGPLGTALRAETWPRPLLIDEIDKSDLDFASDLLNVIEEGESEIAELWRLESGRRTVWDYLGKKAEVEDGKIKSGQFPFVVMTSNAEREFPPPFLRRCVRLTITPPDTTQLTEIINRQLTHFAGKVDAGKITKLIEEFDTMVKKNQDVSTDQLLNAVFLTVAMNDGAERKFSDKELEALRTLLLKQLSGPGS